MKPDFDQNYIDIKTAGFTGTRADYKAYVIARGGSLKGYKQMKRLFVDLETTGLDPIKNGVVEISAMAEIDGEVVDQIHILCRPFVADVLDPQALEFRGETEATLRDKNRMGPKKAYAQLIEFLDAHIDKFDKDDKFVLYGHKIEFDLEFLVSFFMKNDDPYFGSYQNFKPVCTLALARYLHSINASRITRLPNLKLETICKEFGVPIQKAHVAKWDVRGLYSMWSKFEPYLMTTVGE